PEVVSIKTCGFIEEAKQESINAIIEHGVLKKTGACKVLIAAGCLAQRYQGELLKALPELDGVVGTGDTGRIADICRTLLGFGRQTQRVWASPPPYLYDELTPRLRLGKAHSAYVKIAEGCNRNCAFCAIPLMRGKQRSRPIESIVAEATALAADGVKEINLVSQDTINYGVDLGLRQGSVHGDPAVPDRDGIRPGRGVPVLGRRRHIRRRPGQENRAPADGRAPHRVARDSGRDRAEEKPSADRAHHRGDGGGRIGGNGPAAGVPPRRPSPGDRRRRLSERGHGRSRRFRQGRDHRCRRLRPRRPHRRVRTARDLILSITVLAFLASPAL